MCLHTFRYNHIHREKSFEMHIEVIKNFKGVASDVIVVLDLLVYVRFACKLQCSRAQTSPCTPPRASASPSPFLHLTTHLSFSVVDVMGSLLVYKNDRVGMTVKSFINSNAFEACPS